MQPTKLLCPWNFLGNSNGVGCHFFLSFSFFFDLNKKFIKLSQKSGLVCQLPQIPSTLVIPPVFLLHHPQVHGSILNDASLRWVPAVLQSHSGSRQYHFLLQGIFLTQGSNPGLLHYRLNALPSELPGKPHAHRRHWKIFSELVSEFFHSPKTSQPYAFFYISEEIKVYCLMPSRSTQLGDLTSPQCETFESALRLTLTRGSQIQATPIIAKVHCWRLISPSVCNITGVTKRVRW